jgi:hypothetical protein
MAGLRDEPLRLPGKERTGTRALTDRQRLQLALWVLEGLSDDTIRQLAKEQRIGTVRRKDLDAIRADSDLLEQARDYLRRHFTLGGLAERANRIRRLQRLAETLEELIAQGHLIEETSRQIGLGKLGTTTVTERRFAAGLAKEYRDTLEQIRKEVEPIERVIVEREQRTTILLGLSSADRQQLIDALSWQPKQLPQVVAIEGEVTDQSET